MFPRLMTLQLHTTTVELVAIAVVQEARSRSEVIKPSPISLSRFVLIELPHRADLISPLGIVHEASKCPIRLTTHNSVAGTALRAPLAGVLLSELLPQVWPGLALNRHRLHPENGPQRWSTGPTWPPPSSPTTPVMCPSRSQKRPKPKARAHRIDSCQTRLSAPRLPPSLPPTPPSTACQGARKHSFREGKGPQSLSFPVQNPLSPFGHDCGLFRPSANSSDEDSDSCLVLPADEGVGVGALPRSKPTTPSPISSTHTTFHAQTSKKTD